MAEPIVFLVAPLALALFGLPAAWASPIDHFSGASRFAAAFLTGTVAFTVWLTLLSAAGVRWSAGSVVAPLGALSLAGAFVLARRSGDGPCGERLVAGIGVRIAGGLAFSAGLAHLALMAWTSQATSIDYLYFWGVKAQRFAELGGIDAAMLAEPLMIHLHSNYPPLLPLVYAWGIELAGQLPWQVGLATCAIWLAVAAPLVRELMARRLDAAEATLASSFWFLAVALALCASFSAGNAEPPLAMFVGVAVAALLSDGAPETGPGARWLAIVALAGVLLTKNEGLVVFSMIAAGAVACDVVAGRRGRRLWGRSAAVVLVPLAAFGSWIVFELVRGVPMRDATREQAGALSLGHAGEVAVEFVRNLEAGSWWVAWVVALLFLVVGWRRWRELLPALVPLIGVLLFLFVYYLHYQGPALETWMRWTMPRVSLSALNAALIGAAFAASRARDEERSSRNDEGGPEPAS